MRRVTAIKLRQPWFPRAAWESIFGALRQENDAWIYHLWDFFDILHPFRYDHYRKYLFLANIKLAPKAK
jgi:hypothetical protein